MASGAVKLPVQVCTCLTTCTTGNGSLNHIMLVWGVPSSSRLTLQTGQVRSGLSRFLSFSSAPASKKKNSSNSSSSQELVCSVLECMATTTMDLIPHCALCAGKFRNHHGEHPPPGPLHWTTVARSGMNDISLRVYLLFANFVILIINSSRARWTRGRHCATSNGPRLCYSTPCGSSP